LLSRWEGEGVAEVGKDSKTGIVRVRVNTKYFRPAEVVSLAFKKRNDVLDNTTAVVSLLRLNVQFIESFSCSPVKRINDT